MVDLFLWKQRCGLVGWQRLLFSVSSQGAPSGISVFSSHALSLRAVVHRLTNCRKAMTRERRDGEAGAVSLQELL